ncbi:MAG: class III extradiol ring-cleavage dioxygenase [Pseudomonadota bacterium]
MTQKNLSPVLFVPHGGGPLPLLEDPNHRSLITFLKSVSSELVVPDAIIVVTAHWEASVVTVSSSTTPDMIYDYQGFPPESYEFKYPAPGSPELAADIVHCCQQGGVKAVLTDRGFDHGTFVPLMLMFPQARIPIVQISLLSNLDPVAHINLGVALQPLRHKNLLFVGSGMSYHNLPAFFQKDQVSHQQSEEFDHWLTQTCCSSETSESQLEALENWQQAPHARRCHPREEHLLPLLVCAGTAAKTHCARRNYSDTLFDKCVSGYIWR